MFGIDPRKTIHSIRGLPTYFRNLQSLKKQKKSATKEFSFGKPYPCLGDRFSDSGSAKGHYFHQDLLVASRIHLNNPSVHVDVGSRIDGFIAHVASFRPIEVLDIRPLSSEIPNVKFEHATGYKREHPNVSTYAARFYEGRTILGTIAGSISFLVGEKYD